MTKDGFSCFIGFRIFRGRTPPPTFKIRKCMFVIIFQANTAQHKPFKMRFSNYGVNNNSYFLLIFDRWAIILLAKHLLHCFHTIFYHNMYLKKRLGFDKKY